MESMSTYLRTEAEKRTQTPKSEMSNERIGTQLRGIAANTKTLEYTHILTVQIHITATQQKSSRYIHIRVVNLI